MSAIDERTLQESLDRWADEGLISSEQAEAIAAHEGVQRGVDSMPGRPGVSGVVLLQYAGSLVALGAVLGIDFTVLDDISGGGRFGVMLAVAAGWTALAWALSRAGGSAAADATGFGAAVLWYAASLHAFNAVGWLGDESSPGQLRTAFFLSSVVGASVGYGIARTLGAPLAALGVPIAIAWGGGVFGWWLGDTESEGPGTAGAQVMVVLGLLLAALAFTEGTLRLDRAARLWWQIGALSIANVAGVVLAIGEGGAYEGLLLAYAVGLAVAAVLGRQRVAVVFAALTLYEYIGIVVFRTFEGALAAIIILALVGLGTALGGTVAQHGGWRRLRFGQ